MTSTNSILSVWGITLAAMLLAAGCSDSESGGADFNSDEVSGDATTGFEFQDGFTSSGNGLGDTTSSPGIPNIPDGFGGIGNGGADGKGSGNTGDGDAATGTSDGAGGGSDGSGSGTGADGESYPGQDTEVPEGSLQIEINTDGSILSGITPIVATVTGGEWILGVEFHVDGLKVDTDVVPPYTLALDTRNFEDGPHVIDVYTADSKGDFASAFAEVLFDNSPPEILNVVPGDASTVFFEDGPMVLSVEMDEPDKIVNLTMRVNGLLVGEFDSPPFEVSVNYEDVFVTEEELPKTLFVQVAATDVLEQVTEFSFNTQVHRRLRWVHEMVYEVKGSPDVFPNGNVVFGNSGGELYSLSPSGTQVWVQTVTGQIKDGVRVDPETGNVYFGVISGGEGNPIHAFNQDGSSLWSVNYDSPAGGRLAQRGGTVYANLFSGRILALDKNGGGEQWSVDLPDKIVASPAITPSGRLYTGCWDQEFRAVDASGVLWTFGTGDEVRSTAAVGTNAVVYFGSNDGWVYAVDESNGAHVWVQEIEGNIEGELLLVEEEGALYVASSNTYLSKLNMNTGEPIWSTKLDYIVDASPVQGGDGTIYVGSQTDGLGKIFGVNPEDGSIRFAYQVDAVIPDKILVVGDILYFGANDRNFYSLWATDANLYVPEEVPQ